MAELTKGKFITDILLTAKNIAAWKAFRTGTTELSIAVNEAWESSQGVVLTSPFVQGLIGELVPAVLDPASLDRFNAEIARQSVPEPVAVIPWKKYTVSVNGNINVWLAENGNGAEAVIEQTDATNYIIQIRGTLPAPAVEVI